KYGPFNVLEFDQFFNYKLDIDNSSFPEKYPWFHVCELEPFIKRDSKFYKPLFKILACKFNEIYNFSEYLIKINYNSEV
ncbi:hypothetical protein PIROE2DRAFT_17854, partial [Piromyces sp. E2]